MPITDRQGREITYLRVSVTPSCNLKCSYCMPESRQIHPGNRKLLSLKEIERIVTIFVKEGLRKVRITGGEPLIRKGVATLVKDLKSVKGMEEVALTTNGVLLSDNIERLIDNGIDSITISLDTLRPERMLEICGKDVLEPVVENVKAVLGFDTISVKINMVPIKGINDDEIEDFCQLANENRLDVRFIEMMPIAENGLWNDDAPITSKEIFETVSKLFTLKPSDRRRYSGPAKMYNIAGGKGRIGFISPMSASFCGGCNRLRLTSDGKLKSCLLSENEIDLMHGFEMGLGDDWFIKRLKDSLLFKADRHSKNYFSPLIGGRPMVGIGG